MENYEQKYKKALGWMRSLYTGLHGKTREEVETYFPELKESEDDKIRKGLIKGLSAMRDIHHHQTFSDDAINIDDAIAWLEKQGEQKPTWSEEDGEMLLMCSDAIAASYAADYYTAEEMHKMQDWLKSLKPQNRWKPTKEQMEALKCSYKSYIIDGKERRTLESLYNDLKKL